MPSLDEPSHDARPLDAWIDRMAEKLGLHRPELRAWAMYDWANSAMVTTIITAIFPIYYASVACSGVCDVKEAERRYAIVTVMGMVVIALLSPVLGTIADLKGDKKKMLGGFMTMGILSVGAMFFIYHGDWILASALFIFANIGANGSFVFYDALLPHVAREDEIDRVSTAGYALGYIGGGTLLALNLAWYMAPQWFGLPHGEGLTPSQATLPTRLAFLSVAIWWLVFSIPLFRRVAEPYVPPESIPPGIPVRAAFARLLETFKGLRSHRQAFLMLLAFLIYNDGIGTIIRMAVMYGKEIGIDDTIMIGSIMIVQFVGIPCAFLFGMLAQRLGAKKSIGVGLFVYILICVFGYFMKSATHFLILAVLVGAVQGGTQALSRSLFGTLIPKDKSGEFFGFFGVAEKFAGILGPAIFAVVSGRSAILALIVFFIVGGALLYFVDVAEGQHKARADEAAGFAA